LTLFGCLFTPDYSSKRVRDWTAADTAAWLQNLKSSYQLEKDVSGLTSMTGVALLELTKDDFIRIVEDRATGAVIYNNFQSRHKKFRVEGAKVIFTSQSLSDLKKRAGIDGNPAGGLITGEDTELFPVFFTPRRIAHSLDYGKVTLRLFIDAPPATEPSNCLVLEGFPSQSVLPIMVANTIIHQLQLPLIGDITSDEFPGTAFISNGSPSSACRIHGNNSIVVFVAEYELTPEMEKELANVLLDFARLWGAKLVVTVDGLSECPEKNKKLMGLGIDISFEGMDKDDESNHGRNGEEDAPKEPNTVDEESIVKMLSGELAIEKLLETSSARDLWYVTDSEDYGLLMKKAAYKVLRDAVLSGVSGSLLAEASVVAPRRDMAILSLSVVAHAVLPDPVAVIAVIKAMNIVFEEDVIEIKPVLDSLGEISDRMKKVMSGIKKKNEAPFGMYI
jgi:predicted ATP-grasp superfamily ATP-dependent carboligase